MKCLRLWRLGSSPCASSVSLRSTTFPSASRMEHSARSYHLDDLVSLRSAVSEAYAPGCQNNETPCNMTTRNVSAVSERERVCACINTWYVCQCTAVPTCTLPKSTDCPRAQIAPTCTLPTCSLPTKRASFFFHIRGRSEMVAAICSDPNDWCTTTHVSMSHTASMSHTH